MKGAGDLWLMWPSANAYSGRPSFAFAEHPDYKPIYGGDLRSRDGAYHQGTVWAWLIGPFIDAWLKVHHRTNRWPESFSADFPKA